MRTSHLLALALTLVAAAPLAHADDASRRAKAEQMLQLTKTDTLMQQQLSNLEERINQTAQQQFNPSQMSAAQQAIATDYLKQVHSIAAEAVSWTALRPQMIQQYAEAFTEADLDSIIAFYKSPAGQVLVEKTPKLAESTVGLVQAKMKEAGPKLEALTQETATKMKAAAPAAGSTAPSGAGAAPAAKPTPKPAPAPTK